MLWLIKDRKTMAKFFFQEFTFIYSSISFFFCLDRDLFLPRKKAEKMKRRQSCKYKGRRMERNISASAPLVSSATTSLIRGGCQRSRGLHSAFRMEQGEWWYIKNCAALRGITVLRRGTYPEPESRFPQSGVPNEGPFKWKYPCRYSTQFAFRYV